MTEVTKMSTTSGLRSDRGANPLSSALARQAQLMSTPQASGPKPNPLVDENVKPPKALNAGGLMGMMNGERGGDFNFQFDNHSQRSARSG